MQITAQDSGDCKVARAEPDPSSIANLPAGLGIPRRWQHRAIEPARTRLSTRKHSL
jgi:hypothetical protein